MIKKLMAIVTLFSVMASGISAQFDILVNPEKYNLISLDTSSLPSPITEARVDDYVELSEVKMHYKIYGEGEKPLILIHGNGGSTESLKEAATYLANDYTVYVTDSRCHGKSSDPGEISYSLMAKDMVEFINAMGLTKPYIMGHSDGGMIAVTIASEYPDVPGAIISCGSNSAPDKFVPYFPLGVKIKNIFKPNKLNDMMLTLPHWDEEYLGKITCPTYVVCGQYDIMWLTDTLFIHSSIKGSDIAVIKNENHSSYMSQNGKKAYVLATDWFKSL